MPCTVAGCDHSALSIEKLLRHAKLYGTEEVFEVAVEHDLDGLDRLARGLREIDPKWQTPRRADRAEVVTDKPSKSASEPPLTVPERQNGGGKGSGRVESAHGYRARFDSTSAVDVEGWERMAEMLALAPVVEVGGARRNLGMDSRAAGCSTFHCGHCGRESRTPKMLHRHLDACRVRARSGNRCEECDGLLDGMRADARYCSASCRRAHARAA